MKYKITNKNAIQCCEQLFTMDDIVEIKNSIRAREFFNYSNYAFNNSFNIFK